MDLGGSAVGVVSLGIQVCQGLLSYYDAWKDYKSDISATYDAIADLSSTLVLLKGSLKDGHLDPERKQRVERSVQGCEGALIKLSEKNQKLRKYGQPQGQRQKAWAEVQRAFYPFRASTLIKLQELVNDVRERLKLAIQVLQVDLSTRSQGALASLEQRIATIQAVQQSDLWRNIVAWLSPPDPWTNHASARQRHQAGTGTWLLQSNQYRKWKAGTPNHLWMSGKAGCGKTVLYSRVVEDIRSHCETTSNTWLAVFYFSFSDKQKQGYEALLRSAVAQLGWKEPSLTMLRQSYENPNARALGTDELEKILCASVKAYDEVFLLLDALDECPEADDVRQGVLEGVDRLAQSTIKLKILATSRELSEIRESMEILKADQIAIATRAVDADIRTYVSSELSRDRKLSRLDHDSKTEVEKTIAQRADGMFRWAYCQLHELKRLKCFRPSFVRKALDDLPSSLDDTYARILAGIEEMYREDALTLLRWLAYAGSPPTLGQLVEAVVIDPVQDSVGFDDRGDLESTLTILSGLVTTITTNSGDQQDDHSDLDSEDCNNEDFAPNDLDSEDHSRHGILHHVSKQTKVRLAHFSVREYLESNRILNSNASRYHLIPAREHRLLAYSCLAYIKHYGSHGDKTSTKEDLVRFPLLDYAAQFWFEHCSLQEVEDASREVSFLTSEEFMRTWFLVYEPEDGAVNAFEEVETVGAALYYASYLGLEAAVQLLLDKGADINAQGGDHSNALQAASHRGFEKIVMILLDRGAEVNAQGGYYGNALQAASICNNFKIVAMLLERGAYINAQGGEYGNALQAASQSAYGSEDLVTMLLDKGAEVNARGGLFGNALQAASERGFESVVAILLDNGAEVNAQGGELGNALQAASFHGHMEVIAKLLERGAIINALGGEYGTALQAASFTAQEPTVAKLLEKGAHVNAQGGQFGSALQAASFCHKEEVVRFSWDAETNVDLEGGKQRFVRRVVTTGIGHERVVQMLLSAGADVNARGGQYGNALQAAACWDGNEMVVQMLLDAGADINAKGGEYGTALRAASCRGCTKVAELLLERCADVNDGALEKACHAGHLGIVELMLSKGANVNDSALEIARRKGHDSITTLLETAREDQCNDA